ncbi:hypothetical protein IWW38_004435, partial [Coemansia aciculifera]
MSSVNNSSARTSSASSHSSNSVSAAGAAAMSQQQDSLHHFNPAPPKAPFAAAKTARPASEIFFANAQHPLPEARHVDRWFESLS